MHNLIKKYTAAFSVTGREKYLADIIEKDLAPYADCISRDAMGNLIVYKKGINSEKRLMIAAHMDEIGFIVTHIDDNGFIRVSNVGGISPLYSSYHNIIFENGTKGVIVTDVSKSEVKLSDLVIDIGAKDKKEASKKVTIGDICAVAPSFTKLMGKRFTAKALDDRIGCAVAAKAAMSDKVPAYDTYFVLTVQEEVGCRGAAPATFAIKPTYGIAIDITPTGDAVGAKTMAVKLGGGAAIKLKDSGVICSSVIVNAMKEAAIKNKIAFQLEVLEAGGTDTRSIQITADGCHAGCISIPTRYTHSPVECVDMGDVSACTNLLTALIYEGIE